MILGVLSAIIVPVSIYLKNKAKISSSTEIPSTISDDSTIFGDNNFTTLPAITTQPPPTTKPPPTTTQPPPSSTTQPPPNITTIPAAFDDSTIFGDNNFTTIAATIAGTEAGTEAGTIAGTIAGTEAGTIAGTEAAFFTTQPPPATTQPPPNTQPPLNAKSSVLYNAGVSAKGAIGTRNDINLFCKKKATDSGMKCLTTVGLISFENDNLIDIPKKNNFSSSTPFFSKNGVKLSTNWGDLLNRKRDDLKEFVNTSWIFSNSDGTFSSENSCNKGTSSLNTSKGSTSDFIDSTCENSFDILCGCIMDTIPNPPSAQSTILYSAGKSTGSIGATNFDLLCKTKADADNLSCLKTVPIVSSGFNNLVNMPIRNNFNSANPVFTKNGIIAINWGDFIHSKNVSNVGINDFWTFSDANGHYDFVNNCNNGTSSSSIQNGATFNSTSNCNNENDLMCGCISHKIPSSFTTFAPIANTTLRSFVGNAKKFTIQQKLTGAFCILNNDNASPISFRCPELAKTPDQGNIFQVEFDGNDIIIGNTRFELSNINTDSTNKRWAANLKLKQNGKFCKTYSENTTTSTISGDENKGYIRCDFTSESNSSRYLFTPV